MEITINKPAFLKVLRDATSVISNQTVIPSLSKIRIKANITDDLELTTSNGQTSMVVKFNNANVEDDQELNVEVQDTGDICVPGKFLTSVIRKMPEKKIKLKTDENAKRLIVSAKKTKIKIPYDDGTAFPQIPSVLADSDKELLKIDTQTFIDHVKKALVIGENINESRPILNNLHLLVKNQHLLIEITDSHRILRTQMPTIENHLDADILLPIESIKIIMGHLKPDEMPTITIKELAVDNAVKYQIRTMGRFYDISPMVGMYPDLDPVINNATNVQQDHIKIELSTLQIQQITNDCQLATLANGFSTEKDNKLFLEIPDDHTLRLYTADHSVNDELDVTTDGFTSGSYQLCLNSKWLGGDLQNFTEDINFDFFGEIKPYKITPADNNDQLYIGTPIKTA